MGSFSMTCSASGLSIAGGTPVRCFLMTASPYANEWSGAAPWLIRTPPLRAVYNDYGSIEDIHPDDRPIADLWLRGLREDIVDKGQGDNSCHDVPATRSMTFDALLEAINEGRIEVRQDAKHFWRIPRDDWSAPSLASRVTAALEAAIPGSVTNGSAEGKYVVDEPVPALVRVRFGQYEHGDGHMAGLECGLAVIRHAGFVGVIAAGSGRYADDADLLVFPAPNPAEHTRGPQWDTAAGQDADPCKRLRIGMAMIRDDVWQAFAAYPHRDYHDGLWYALDAYKEGVRATWAAIVKHFAGHHRERLTFGDFYIAGHSVDNMMHPGTGLMIESTPGVIGIAEHLAMLLADKAEPGIILDALAELAAVADTLRAVGVQLRPAASSGPQYAEWPEFVRFHRTLLAIAEREVAEMEEPSPCSATLDEAIAKESR